MEQTLTAIADHLTSQSLHLIALFALLWGACWLTRKASAHVRYLLWMVFLAKCLAPPVFSIALPVLPAKAQAAAPLAIPAPEFPALDETGIQGFNGSKGAVGTPPAQPGPVPMAVPAPPPAAHVPSFSLKQWLAVAWAAGAALFLAYAAIKAWSIRARLIWTRRPANDLLRDEIESLREPLDAMRMPRVWSVPGVSQPFVWGIFRGDVYIPEDFLRSGDFEDRRAILMHELGHVARRDAAINALQVLVQALYFFHPLVWLANSLIRHEREKCCDEWVLVRLKAAPQKYGEAIVNSVARNVESDLALSTLAVSGSLRRLESRLKDLMAPGRVFRGRASWKSMLACVFLALFLAPTAVSFSPAVQAGDIAPTDHFIKTKADLIAAMRAQYDRIQNIECSFRTEYTYTKPVLAPTDGRVVLFEHRLVQSGLNRRISEKYSTDPSSLIDGQSPKWSLVREIGFNGRRSWHYEPQQETGAVDIGGGPDPNMLTSRAAFAYLDYVGLSYIPDSQRHSFVNLLAFSEQANVHLAKDMETVGGTACYVLYQGEVETTPQNRRWVAPEYGFICVKSELYNGSQNGVPIKFFTSEGSNFKQFSDFRFPQIINVAQYGPAGVEYTATVKISEANGVKLNQVLPPIFFNPDFLPPQASNVQAASGKHLATTATAGPPIRGVVEKALVGRATLPAAAPFTPTSASFLRGVTSPAHFMNEENREAPLCLTFWPEGRIRLSFLDTERTKFRDSGMGKISDNGQGCVFFDQHMLPCVLTVESDDKVALALTFLKRTESKRPEEVIAKYAFGRVANPPRPMQVAPWSWLDAEVRGYKTLEDALEMLSSERGKIPSPDFDASLKPFLDELPKDPHHAAETLHWIARENPARIVIYSVGGNGRDEKGEGDDIAPWTLYGPETALGPPMPDSKPASTSLSYAASPYGAHAITDAYNRGDLDAIVPFLKDDDVVMVRQQAIIVLGHGYGDKPRLEKHMQLIEKLLDSPTSCDRGAAASALMSRDDTYFRRNKEKIAWMAKNDPEQQTRELISSNLRLNPYSASLLEDNAVKKALGGEMGDASPPTTQLAPFMASLMDADRISNLRIFSHTDLGFTITLARFEVSSNELEEIIQGRRILHMGSFGEDPRIKKEVEERFEGAKSLLGKAPPEVLAWWKPDTLKDPVFAEKLDRTIGEAWSFAALGRTSPGRTEVFLFQSHK